MELRPKIREIRMSKISGPLRVVSGGGVKHISTDKIQHSGGIVREIWEKGLKNWASPKSNWLILGVGGGSVVELIEKKYAPIRITGVEADPIMLELGNKYLDLGSYAHLKIIETEAEKFMRMTSDKWDMGVVDIFGAEGCPKFIYQADFLRRCKNKCGQIAINQLFDSKERQDSARRLELTMKSIWPAVERIAVRQNVVLRSREY